MIEDFIKSEEMRNLSDIIPQKYLNLKAVLFLLEVLQTGRADSSKEAYNLYEEELHREKKQRDNELCVKKLISAILLGFATKTMVREA